MDDNRNFYISGYIAVGSYIVLVLSFLFFGLTKDVKKFDAISKDTILELDIVLNKNTTKTKSKKVASSKKNNKISKKVVKKSTSVRAKQRSDLKSLFANVKTKSTVVRKKVVNKIKKSSITSRFKSKFEKQTYNKNTQLSKLLENKDTKLSQIKAGDSNNNKDPYMSKIYDILFKRWIPSVIIDGLSAKVIVTIYINGDFTYKFIQYSGDSSFDNHLEYFLEEQKSNKFPIPKKNKVDIEVIFTAKG